MKNIRHTGIVVTDLEESLCFFRDLLGFKIVKQMEESGGFIDKITGLEDAKVTTVKMAADDGNLIELLYYHSHPRKLNNNNEICRIGVTHIAFSVDNLDAEYKRLLEAGVEFNSPPQLSPDGYAKVAFCKGPDEVFIELVEVLQ